MKKLSIIIATVLFSFGVANAVVLPNGDDSDVASHTVGIKIQEVALVDIEVSENITLAPAKPTEAGLGFDFSTATNSSAWLNYSSIVKSGKTRTITAELEGTLPGGTFLTVAVSNPAADKGKGVKGTGTTAKPFGSDAMEVVSGIGSCYTGDGVNSGTNLTYQLNEIEANEYGTLYASENNYSVTITYTISDQD